MFRIEHVALFHWRWTISRSRDKYWHLSCGAEQHRMIVPQRRQHPDRGTAFGWGRHPDGGKHSDSGRHPDGGSIRIGGGIRIGAVSGWRRHPNGGSIRMGGGSIWMGAAFGCRLAFTSYEAQITLFRRLQLTHQEKLFPLLIVAICHE